MTICNNCGKEFEGRADAKTCSTSCRVALSRKKEVVEEAIKETENSEKGFNGYTVVGTAPFLNGNSKPVDPNNPWGQKGRIETTDRRLYHCSKHGTHVQKYCEAMCKDCTHA